MNGTRSIQSVISHSIAATFFALTAGSANAQIGQVTWTLNGVSQFASGESASGSFTVDPAMAPGAPPGTAGVMVAWEIAVAGGTNPLIPSVTFSGNDSGCLLFCAQLSNNRSHDGGASLVIFRTPLSPDNTYYQLGLAIFATAPDALIFPTSEELPLITPDFHIPASTNIAFEQYDPSANQVRPLARSDLQAGGSVVIAAAVPEPAAVELLVTGLAVIGAGCVMRRSAPGTRPIQLVLKS
jgi:hypothetical protein